MEKILLLIQGASNRKLLSEFLKKEFEIIEGFSEELFEKPFDLAVFDVISLRKWKSHLQKKKQKEKPVYLPYLLIASQQEITFSEYYSDELIDEIVFAPVKKIELKMRVRSLLNTRKLSKELEEQTYKIIVETALQGFAIFQNGKLVFLNPTISNFTGYMESEILALTVEELKKMLYPEDRERVTRIFREKISQKNFQIHEEFRILDKTDRVKWLEVIAVNTSYKGMPAIQISCRDITRSKEQEKHLLESYEKLRKTLEGTVKALGRALEFRDPYTAGHQTRVAILANAIAEEMGCDKKIVEGVKVASLLHDIGKIAVPAEILTKPTHLTDVEFELIKTHPQVAYEILSDVDFPWPVPEIVLQHHERLDGSGYPLGLKGNEIIFEAKILALADVVEAMSSHRPYRPARSLKDTLEEIVKNKDKIYDPVVVDACINLYKKGNFPLIIQPWK